MEQLITRQPAFLLEADGYREKMLNGLKDSFCYELTIEREIILVPNGCLMLIWNMNRKELYCLEYMDKCEKLGMTGDKLFGIQLNYRYQCRYDRAKLMLWMEKMGELASFDERVECCREQIEDVLHLEEVHPLIRYGLEQIEGAKGKVAIETVAIEFGYTSRHMERLFLQTFSCGPKRFCQYIRLLNAISNMIQYPDRNLSSLIENIGYSDQSHFQREFKKIIGMTPKQFVKKYLENTYSVET